MLTRMGCPMVILVLKTAWLIARRLICWLCAGVDAWRLLAIAQSNANWGENDENLQWKLNNINNQIVDCEDERKAFGIGCLMVNPRLEIRDRMLVHCLLMKSFFTGQLMFIHEDCHYTWALWLRALRQMVVVESPRTTKYFVNENPLNTHTHPHTSHLRINRLSIDPLNRHG